MDKNNLDIIETDEMDIYEEMRQVEVSVAKNIEGKRELIQTRYYKEFVLTRSMNLKNLFITKEEDKNKKISYHFRWFEKKLSTIEENVVVEDGIVYTSPELKDILGNINIDVEELIDINDSGLGILKGISEKLKPEQTKKLFVRKTKKN